MKGAPKDGQLMELELLLLKFKQSVSIFASKRIREWLLLLVRI